jgi:hypothetical protein
MNSNVPWDVLLRGARVFNTRSCSKRKGVISNFPILDSMMRTYIYMYIENKNITVTYQIAFVPEEVVLLEQSRSVCHTV